MVNVPVFFIFLHFLGGWINIVLEKMKYHYAHYQSYEIMNINEKHCLKIFLTTLNVTVFLVFDSELFSSCLDKNLCPAIL